MLPDLRLKRFGLLTVRHYAGTRGQKRYWCCTCACLTSCRDCAGAGCLVRVRGTKLLTGKQVSCGCSRTDSDRRTQAAMKVPVKVRHERACKGGKCRAGVDAPAFLLTLTRAADLMGVPLDRVVELARSGVIRTVYRKSGRTMASVTDVAAWIERQQKSPKSCGGTA